MLMEEPKGKETPRGEKATLQGTVSWSEQKATRHFRSMLELISLMNDALIEDENLAKWSQDEKYGEDESR